MVECLFCWFGVRRISRKGFLTRVVFFPGIAEEGTVAKVAAL